MKEYLSLIIVLSFNLLIIFEKIKLLSLKMLILIHLYN